MADSKVAAPRLGEHGHVQRAASEPARIGGTKEKSGTVKVEPRAEGRVEVVEHSRFQQEFKRLRLVGRGAFGEVWHCQRLSDGKEFAVKVVRYRSGGTHAHGRQVRGHVVREAEMLALMGHPNVLRFHTAWIESKVTTCGGALTPATTAGSPSDHMSSVAEKELWRQLSAPNADPMEIEKLAPPPSPCLNARHPPPALLGPDEGSDDGSFCSYDGGSYGTCEGDIVFLDWQDEEERNMAVQPQHSKRVESLPKVAAPQEGVPACAARHRPSPLGTTCQEDADACPEYTATLYIQVELCRDETLQGWIEKRNEKCRSDEDDDGTPGTPSSQLQDWAKPALSIFIQCIRALEHMHGKKCVHRDVKPANVLFARGGGCAIRLGDLGLAKVVDEGEGDREGGEPSPPLPDAPQHLERQVSPVCSTPCGRPRTSGRGGTVGTPSYASPEQLAGALVGFGTDVYSMGLVLAELLCPVSTQMERAAVLEGLRVRQELPASATLAFPELAHLAVQMTDPDPLKRPEACSILRAARQVQRTMRKASAEGSVSTVARVKNLPPLPIKGAAPWQRQPKSRRSAAAHVPPTTGSGAWSRRMRAERQQKQQQLQQQPSRQPAVRS